MMINPGQLDTPIEFWAMTYEIDDYGGTVETWAIVPGAPKWGKLEPLKGLTRVEMSKVTAIIPLKLTIRYFPDLDTTYKVKIKGLMYRIESVEDYNRGGYQILWIKVHQ